MRSRNNLARQMVSNKNQVKKKPKYILVICLLLNHPFAKYSSKWESCPSRGENKRICSTTEYFSIWKVITASAGHLKMNLPWGRDFFYGDSQSPIHSEKASSHNTQISCRINLYLVNPPYAANMDLQNSVGALYDTNPNNARL